LLGLTEIESKVYLVLLKIGSTTTGPLVKATELHRATVYDVLKRLMEKGLANYIIKEKTKYFQATKPEHLRDLIEEEKENLKKKEENVMHLVYKLNKVQELAKNKENAHVFVGKRGAKTILDDVLRCKEYVALGSGGAFLDVLGHVFLNFQKRKKELKIKSKIIMPDNARDSRIYKTTYAEVRFIPKQYHSPVSIIVYSSKVALIIWLENPVAFLIESKEAAESFRNYFEMLWKIAKD